MHKDIIDFHAHLYFTDDKIDLVHKVIQKVKEKYNFEIGRIWGSPVGPHPLGSCQILVPKENFGEFIPWLMEQREELDVFVHANTGNDLADHTQYIMWLGKSYKINTDRFL